MMTSVRGKSWSALETKVLVEAYIHCSEDEIKSTNQSREAFFESVEDEAKRRYSGIWTRPVESMRKRWRVVSSDVQRFIDAMEVATSIEHSGWNEEMCPIGLKKAKQAEEINKKLNMLLDNACDKAASDKEDMGRMFSILQENKEQSQQNVEKFQQVFEGVGAKLTEQLKRNGEAATKVAREAHYMKMLVEMEMTGNYPASMTEENKAQCRKKMMEGFGSFFNEENDKD